MTAFTEQGRVGREAPPAARRRLRWACAAAGLFAVVGSASAGPPATQAETWDHEQYYAAYMNSRRVGYYVERERKLPDGRVESFTGHKLAVAAIGRTVTITTTDRRVESADGAPLGFSQQLSLGLVPIQREGVIRDGQLELTITQGAQTLKRTQRWDERVRFEPAVRRMLKDKLKADGDEAAAWLYSTELPGEGFSASTFRRVGVEEVQASGRRVRAVHVAETNPALPAVQHQWLDDSFRAVAAEASLGPGMSLRLEACSKQFAHEQFDAPEVFTTNLIQLDKPLAEVEKIRSVRLTLTFARPLDEPLSVPRTDRQRPVESTVDRLVVDLFRPDYPATQPDGGGPVGEALKPYLQPSEVFNITDSEIAAAAREAVGDRTDPLAKARAIRDWVDGRLAFKDMGVGAGTASEVLRSRTGDCTEHAVLLVALARSAGLAARTVQGLVYAGALGQRRNILGFHAWSQVFVHGRWVDFDAAIPGEPAHAVRLMLAASAADGKFDLSAGRGIYRLFGNVRSATVGEVARD